MHDFKLIAIKPLIGCNQRFIKNLTPGEAYVFYDEYKLLNEKGKTASTEEDIYTIEHQPIVPNFLYNIKNQIGRNIHINISAIIGKNGSGKSSISELLLYCIFIISHNLKLIVKDTFLNRKSNQSDKPNEIDRFNIDLNSMSDGLKASIFFTAKGKYYKLVIENGFCHAFVLSQKKAGFFVKDDFKNIAGNLFYTIVTNYSFHAFNTNQMGIWLKAFFHKNDGYRMPIAINPYREEGNIDVNIENTLAASRLLSNILTISNYRQINAKSPINEVELSFNANKDYSYLKNGSRRFSDSFIEKFRTMVLSPLFNLYFNDQEMYPQKLNRLQSYAEIYLINKLIKIPSRYLYFSDFDFRRFKRDRPDNFVFDEKTATDYVKELYRYRGHITLKVRQVLNFLRQDIYNFPNDGKVTHSLNFEAVVNAIKDIKEKDWFTESIDYLPPPLFNSRIKFKDGSYFDQLSSGERQQIHTLNSVIYHLKNIDSVNKSKDFKQNVVSYDKVNLVFDEIELYYHPEFQKRSISDLLSLLKGSDFKYIKSINIIYITHSPFILSDIPIQNTLVLELDPIDFKPKQVKSKEQSFGANITDLLATSFFLETGLVGNISQGVIQNLIDNLQLNEQKRIQRKLKVFEIKQLINIIAEPFLKQKFEEMYEIKFGESLYKIRDRQERIFELEKELKKLKNDRD